MANQEPEPEVLSALVRLMSTTADLSNVTDAQLVEAARTAHESRRVAEGKAASELHARGWTWEKIGEAIGVDLSTAYRWAMEHRRRASD